jgi:hypothetical protein
VGRLHPNSTVESVKAHLQITAAITDVEVIKIDPKTEFQNKYSAYQTSCDFDILDKIKDPNIWPKDTIINNFYFKNNFSKTGNPNTPT